DGRNPAHGHITITKKEKRKAAALGSEPFNIEQLKNIFDFSHFHDLGNERDRWVALICVYTGARSNEIAKMEVADIVREEGVWVF
ncbi:integrase, partial [Xanthomonas citri pv. citri]|nr:integrase [Xanthomonas citri pv. citri]